MLKHKKQWLGSGKDHCYGRATLIAVSPYS